MNRFAEATGDRQWIHTDPGAGEDLGAFGGTVAHGYLTLSLAPALLWEVLEVPEAAAVVNYGLTSCASPHPCRSARACGWRSTCRAWKT